ncbi:hypothetical protein AVEN_119957-1 [Araneus ventricosus]|uniref:Uncharacterized protein n=1 Tax=Araneus ventricosus TaxID=182803 RepID=A0A4Y2IEI6_ARAVE|nr:hypothetical protein AVEN_119957-1 [Araneus ventricosus]
MAFAWDLRALRWKLLYSSTLHPPICPPVLSKGLVARCRPTGRRAQGSKPDDTADTQCIGTVDPHIGYRACCMHVVKHPPTGVVRKFEEGVSTQVSSSSSDRGLRGPSQNIPRVASRRDVNKAKLN